MSLPLAMRVEPLPSATVEQTAMAIWVLGMRMDMSVVCRVQDVDMVVVPGCTADEILAAWKAARMKLLGKARPGRKGG